MIKLLKKRASPKSNAERFRDFDLLATLVAVVRSDGIVLFANAALEDAVGTSRRTIEGSQFADGFTEPAVLKQALSGARGNKFAALRYDAWLQRLSHDPIPVHVIVTQTEVLEEIVVELLPLEQQTRQDREERLADQAQANKELIRNLAHEIKNPLGGIRGAAQLLELEIAERGLRSPQRAGGRPPEGGPAASGRPSDSLREYTQVIIHEADRLQSLVDRLLAPHRRARVVETVNIHEVCERVRSLIAVEYSRGLKVIREYDVSIPEFRADREQLIQAVLNIAQNACQALGERIAAGDARLTFMTRIARNITFGKQRYRLALELHVIDNGPGVPDSIKDRIFYPLVSGREGGSGLGLTLAQTFVQQHYGLIDVESAPGHTDFTILIPLP